MGIEVARFLGFAFANADLLIEVDAEGIVGFASGALQSLTGYSDKDLVGKPLDILIAPADQGLFRRLIRTAEPNSRIEARKLSFEAVHGTTPLKLSGYRLGHSRILQLTLARVEDAPTDGEQRDDETGLLVTDDFQAHLESMLDCPEGAPSSKLTLLKIPDYSRVKSRLGPIMTTRLLSDIGALLRLQATGETLAGRLAEDRFGVVHAATLDGKALASEISQAAKALQNDLSITVDSMSIDTAAPGLTAKDAARVLLYVVKRFAEDSDVQTSDLQDAARLCVLETVGRISDIRSSLSNDRLTLQYQPIVWLSNASLHHFEALVRFPDSAPGPTISFAEQICMVEDIDLVICQKALETLAENAGNPMLEIAVNMSAVSLASDVFISSFQALVGPYGKLRSRLLIEVTESSTILDLPRAARVLDRLRGAGHRICLDDFGAGAASFPYLQALPVDYVKIDGAYVKRLGSPRDGAILRAMVGLCRDLSIEIVAEMVETEDQAQQLHTWGVDLAQGYFFGRPTDAPIYQPSKRLQGSKRQGTREI